MRRALAVGLLVVLACSDPTAPTDDVAGRYVGTLFLEISNAIEGEDVTQPASFTLNQPSRSTGAFTGSWTQPAPYTSSGSITGTARSDGGITIDGAMDANTLQGLQNLFDWCDLDFLSLTAFTGSAVNGILTAQLTMTFPCFYGAGAGTAYATTLTYRWQGTR